MKNGALVKSDYQPRGYCGSSVFVASKNNTNWLTKQLQLQNLETHYNFLAVREIQPYTGNEDTDGHRWYRTCFLAVKPKPDLQQLALRTLVTGPNTQEGNEKKHRTA